MLGSGRCSYCMTYVEVGAFTYMSCIEFCIYGEGWATGNTLLSKVSMQTLLCAPHIQSYNNHIHQPQKYLKFGWPLDNPWPYTLAEIPHAQISSNFQSDWSTPIWRHNSLSTKRFDLYNVLNCIVKLCTISAEPTYYNLLLISTVTCGWSQFWSSNGNLFANTSLVPRFWNSHFGRSRINAFIHWMIGLRVLKCKMFDHWKL